MPAFTLGLLGTNKAINREASSLLYGRNRFEFTGTTAAGVSTFLETIGSNNSALIQHILIDSPQFRHLEPGNVALDEEDISLVTSIHSWCPNLSTLTTALHSTNEMEFQIDESDNHNVAREALGLLDALFRVGSSMQVITLMVYKDGPSDYIRRRMETLDWTFTFSEYDEEEFWDSPDRFGSDGFGDCESDYDDGSDDYDIDNDSDFWRRAAD